ncbi:PWWP domain-containing DNA repair factor 3A isoform X9 [Pipistrellus kuhlii]|uniref:PWWP domain-containing DNA repair factor 3A isoform X9 n=1 Tax=Pipistrellus kuhlii TaxID=59472 RepID=UPI00174EDC4E|nr:PWWP domain-containing DNA repair factor 3A isoform X9 [Pipistrellus kuhlii]
MTDAKYVLCRWKERLWPAKVLTRTEMSTTKKKKGFFLNVQILSLDKKVRVKSTEAKILRKSHIEDIAALLDHQSSEESMEYEPVNSILEEEEEEEEPPRILLYHGQECQAERKESECAFH